MLERASLIALLLCAGAASAQPPGPMPQQGRRGPPQEAFDACKGKSEGDAVEVKSPRGQVKGVCRMVMIPSEPREQEGQRPAR